MGSGNVGQGGRLETAELLNRGRRRRFNSRGQAANDRRRNAVWNSVQVRNGEKCTRRTEESKCIVFLLWILNLLLWFPKLWRPRFECFCSRTLESHSANQVSFVLEEEGFNSGWFLFFMWSAPSGEVSAEQLAAKSVQSRWATGVDVS